MAVKAPNLTFGDFRDDAFESDAVTDELTDISQLLPANMIKNEHNRVSFTAINAGVFSQVIEHGLALPIANHSVCNLQTTLTCGL